MKKTLLAAFFFWPLVSLQGLLQERVVQEPYPYHFIPPKMQSINAAAPENLKSLFVVPEIITFLPKCVGFAIASPMTSLKVATDRLFTKSLDYRYLSFHPLLEKIQTPAVPFSIPCHEEAHTTTYRYTFLTTSQLSIISTPSLFEIDAPRTFSLTSLGPMGRALPLQDKTQVLPKTYPLKEPSNHFSLEKVAPTAHLYEVDPHTTLFCFRLTKARPPLSTATVVISACAFLPHFISFTKELPKIPLHPMQALLLSPLTETSSLQPLEITSFVEVLAHQSNASKLSFYGPKTTPIALISDPLSHPLANLAYSLSEENACTLPISAILFPFNPLFSPSCEALFSYEDITCLKIAYSPKLSTLTAFSASPPLLHSQASFENSKALMERKNLFSPPLLSVPCIVTTTPLYSIAPLQEDYAHFHSFSLDIPAYPPASLHLTFQPLYFPSTPPIITLSFLPHKMAHSPSLLQIATTPNLSWENKSISYPEKQPTHEPANSWLSKNIPSIACPEKTEYLPPLFNDIAYIRYPLSTPSPTFDCPILSILSPVVSPLLPTKNSAQRAYQEAVAPLICKHNQTHQALPQLWLTKPLQIASPLRHTHQTIARTKTEGSFCPSKESGDRLAQSNRCIFKYLSSMPDLDALNVLSLSQGIDHVVEIMPTPDEDGYIFAITLTPTETLPLQSIEQNVLFVLDHTANVKKHQYRLAQDALNRAVKYLSSDSRFNVLIYDNSPTILSVDFLKYNKKTAKRLKQFFTMHTEPPCGSTTPQHFMNTIPKCLPRQGENTVICLTHSNLFSNIEEHHLKSLSQVGFPFTLFAATSGQSVDKDQLQLFTSLSNGKTLYSQTNAAFPRKFSLFVKQLSHLLMQSIAIHASPKDDETTFQIFPPKEHLFAHNPITIYGYSDALCDIGLLLQGKLGEQFVSIKKTISLKNAAIAGKPLQNSFSHILQQEKQRHRINKEKNPHPRLLQMPTKKQPST